MFSSSKLAGNPLLLPVSICTSCNFHSGRNADAGLTLVKSLTSCHFRSEKAMQRHLICSSSSSLHHLISASYNQFINHNHLQNVHVSLTVFAPCSWKINDQDKFEYLTLLPFQKNKRISLKPFITVPKKGRREIEGAADNRKEFSFRMFWFKQRVSVDTIGSTHIFTFKLKLKKDSDCGFYPQPLGDDLAGKS